MKEIWAPWRIEYIKKAKERGCFLCKSVKSRRDRVNHVLKRGTTCVVVMNRYPYNAGHLMVAPRRHVADLHQLTAAEKMEIMQLLMQSCDALKKVCRPQGFNIGINIGAAAGAGLKDHLHLHIVPRWRGDTNFMPVVSDTRVVPQALNELWDALHKVLAGK